MMTKKSKISKTVVYGFLAVVLAFTLALAFTACKDKADDELNPMIRIDGGTFTMGSPASEIGSGADETQWQVTLSGFYMSKYEVTQKQWYEVMGTTQQELQTAAAPTVTTDYGKGDNYPVYYVSWYDAVEFCNKLSENEGLTPYYTIDKTTSDPNNTGQTDTTKWLVTPNTTANGYRLPTEAQWEYAARGGPSASSYKIYSGSNSLDDVAWNSGNNGASGTATYGTKQVGTKSANELGIHDMTGNVSEWCWDWHGTYPNTAQTNPTGVTSGTSRIRRGGGWNNYDALRSAARGYSSPVRRDINLGFRLVLP